MRTQLERRAGQTDEGRAERRSSESESRCDGWVKRRGQSQDGDGEALWIQVLRHAGPFACALAQSLSAHVVRWLDQMTVCHILVLLLLLLLVNPLSRHPSNNPIKHPARTPNPFKHPFPAEFSTFNSSIALYPGFAFDAFSALRDIGPTPPHTLGHCATFAQTMNVHLFTFDTRTRECSLNPLPTRSKYNFEERLEPVFPSWHPLRVLSMHAPYVPDQCAANGLELQPGGWVRADGGRLTHLTTLSDVDRDEWIESVRICNVQSNDWNAWSVSIEAALLYGEK
ncbi:hypothetical protein BC830DRAFT_1174590 [Chytriomyces sp. MP71]|nr:hypothetical protein BC830DRAFT_1174590 [Chytriomyces sp. MP71]